MYHVEKRGLRRCENRVLRKIFARKRMEITGDGRKLHNEERHHLYSSLNVIQMIRSRRVRWAGHVARMGVEFIQGKLEGKNHMRDLA
jgi:hypothetical protein